MPTSGSRITVGRFNHISTGDADIIIGDHVGIADKMAWRV